MNGNAQIPDVHVNTPTGNINLAKAKELDPTVTALTAENRWSSESGAMLA